MKVKNKYGQRPKCRCDSWRAHFKNYGSGASTRCAVAGCASAADVGAHVTKPRTGDREFVVPMCNGHNQTYGVWLDLNASITPAIANRAKTCR